MKFFLYSIIILSSKNLLSFQSCDLVVPNCNWDNISNTCECTYQDNYGVRQSIRVHPSSVCGVYCGKGVCNGSTLLPSSSVNCSSIHLDE